jgi:hypothetical protein
LRLLGGSHAGREVGGGQHGAFGRGGRG